MAVAFSHERLIVEPGRRTGLPLVIAVHSTVLGPAVGGCRVKPYDTVTDAIADALRLAEAMTYKAAVVDNGTGGGKSVVMIPANWAGDGAVRTALFLDLAELVESLGGAYHVAPDVGSTPQDMAVARRRTRYVGGLPAEVGGAGGTTFGTALGVHAALAASARRVLGRELKDLHVAIQGLGGVGFQLAERLVREGARVSGTDVSAARRGDLEALGGRWVAPEDILAIPCDVLAPCALGGVLTAETIPQITARLIVGAANNQLSHDSVAALLEARGVTFVPDFIASAGGLAYGTGIEIHGQTPEACAAGVVRRIETALEAIFEARDRSGTSLLAGALSLAARRLEAGRRTRAGE